MHQESSIKLSILIPVFNEENFLEKLLKDIKTYFDNTNTQVIFVDDGSEDNSFKIIKDFKDKKNYLFNLQIIKLEKNSGKGKALQVGLKECVGEYILLQDADLELDTKDAFEMFEMIQSNNEIKCIFGSRYLSGKLKRNNYFFNNLIGKLNSLIFNILFSQSLSDVHCGLKILHNSVLKKINLTVNDFGIEIDLASQIVRNKFFIYEFGVSYYFRTKDQGKKITWLDGIKSFYYLMKARFYDNSNLVNLSIIFSSVYMLALSFFLNLNIFFNITFFLIGCIIGINLNIIPSILILSMSTLGLYFVDNIIIKIISFLILFLIGLFLSKKLKIFFSKSKLNHLF